MIECAIKFKSNEPQETLRKVFNKQKKNLRKTIQGQLRCMSVGVCMLILLVFRQLTKHYFENDGP